MKKASSSFLLFVLALLFVSFQTYAQVRNQMIQEQVNQGLRPYERVRLAELLRLRYQDESQLEVVSLRISAQNLSNGNALLEVSDRGRVVSTQSVNRQLREYYFNVPQGVLVADLEISSPSQVYLSQITAEVRARYNPTPYPGQIPGPGPVYESPVNPNSLVTLRVQQTVRGFAAISLDQLLRNQYGQTFAGAQIERVVVNAEPVYLGRTASLQVELNRRAIGDIRQVNTRGEYVLFTRTTEPANSLNLIVNGDAHILEVKVRVLQVGSQYPDNRPSTRYNVNRELKPNFPLQLSEIVRSESRLITAITIEARAAYHQGQAQINLVGQGQVQGVVYTGVGSTRVRIQLRRPMAVREIKLETYGYTVLESITLHF